MSTYKRKSTKVVFFGTRGSQVQILSPRPLKTPTNTDKSTAETAQESLEPFSLNSLPENGVSFPELWDFCGPLEKTPVLVDESDWPHISGYQWYPREGYIVCGRGFRLHRFLMGAVPGEVVDHVNGNPLDNRRSNLRICTQAENVRNRRKTTSTCSSKYKGVWFANRQAHTEKPWRAHIRIQGKPTYIGSYATEVEAAHAYDAAALKHHGKFARPNFPLAQNLCPICGLASIVIPCPGHGRKRAAA